MQQNSKGGDEHEILLADGLLDTARAANGSWRICEKVSVSTVSRRPGDRAWNDLLGQRVERSIDTVHIVTGCDALAANAIDAAAASVSGNAAFGAADTEFAGRLAIARCNDAEQPDTFIAERIAIARRNDTEQPDTFAERIAVARRNHAAHAAASFAERIAVADAGHDRS